ncbi:alpha/beta fold hydrolase [Deltaproteobacteria bacterium TL4]
MSVLVKQLEVEPEPKELVDTSTSSALVRSRGMMIRTLCNRIYQLLRRATSQGGENIAQIIAEAEDRHAQYIFDKIYKELHTRYFNSLQDREKNPRKRVYLIQEKDCFYLRSLSDLMDIFKLLGLASTYHDVAPHLRKRINRRVFETMLKDVPRSRILYEDRYTPTPYHFDVIETTEIHRVHPDGNPIPFFIKHIYIHKIFKFHGSCVKIWEFVPLKVTKPTPVCLVPGFVSNYYSFHSEGNESIDYYLVREGSRLFVLDHDKKDRDANIDVYTEYLITTMVDFVVERTGLSRVILGGHSMGGMIAIFKTILDSVRRPKFMNSIKALMILASPVNFDSDYWVPQWFCKAFEMGLDVFGYQGNVMASGPLKMIFSIPMIEYLICHDMNTKILKNLQKLPVLEYNRLLQWLLDFKINPITTDPKFLKALAERAVTNPPRMVAHHFIKFVKGPVEGVTSYNYDEYALMPYDIFDSDTDPNKPLLKGSVGINYTENIYRISPATPVLAIQAVDDILSPSRSFYRFWNKWPHLCKLRLDSDPEKPDHTDENSKHIKNFILKNGLSTAIGVTVQSGRHLGLLKTEKKLVASFIDAIEQLPDSRIQIVKTVIDAQSRWIQRTSNESQRFISERDLAKKIRHINPNLYWSERKTITQLLLQFMAKFEPSALVDEKYHNFMVRDRKKIEDNEGVKYNVFHNCVMTIMAFKPEPTELMKEIFEVATLPEKRPHPACLRSLIDLSLGLFDLSRNGLPDKHGAFLKWFEQFLEFCIDQLEHSVALHAVRAYFHTRDEYFIEKGGLICTQLPYAARKNAYKIFWDEVNQRIGELQDSNSHKQHHLMTPYVKIAKQLAYPN